MLCCRWLFRGIDVVGGARSKDQRLAKRLQISVSNDSGPFKIRPKTYLISTSCFDQSTIRIHVVDNVEYKYLDGAGPATRQLPLLLTRKAHDLICEFPISVRPLPRFLVGGVNSCLSLIRNVFRRGRCEALRKSTSVHSFHSLALVSLRGISCVAVAVRSSSSLL